VNVIQYLLIICLIYHELFLVYDKQPASRPLNIISIRPSGKIISFDCKSRCQMEFSTKVCIDKNYELINDIL
jgi:hypothetical protein